MKGRKCWNQTIVQNHLFYSTYEQKYIYCSLQLSLSFMYFSTISKLNQYPTYKGSSGFYKKVADCRAIYEILIFHMCHHEGQKGASKQDRDFAFSAVSCYQNELNKTFTEAYSTENDQLQFSDLSLLQYSGALQP